MIDCHHLNVTRFIYPNFRNYRQIDFLRGNKFENTSSSTHLFWVIVVGGDKKGGDKKGGDKTSYLLMQYSMSISQSFPMDYYHYIMLHAIRQKPSKIH